MKAEGGWVAGRSDLHFDPSCSRTRSARQQWHGERNTELLLSLSLSLARRYRDGETCWHSQHSQHSQHCAALAVGGRAAAAWQQRRGRASSKAKPRFSGRVSFSPSFLAISLSHTVSCVNFAGEFVTAGCGWGQGGCPPRCPVRIFARKSKQRGGRRLHPLLLPGKVVPRCAVPFFFGAVPALACILGSLGLAGPIRSDAAKISSAPEGGLFSTRPADPRLSAAPSTLYPTAVKVPSKLCATGDVD